MLPASKIPILQIDSQPLLRGIARGYAPCESHYTTNSKAIRLRICELHDLQKRGGIKFAYIPTKENRADPPTKILPIPEKEASWSKMGPRLPKDDEKLQMDPKEEKSKDSTKSSDPDTLPSSEAKLSKRTINLKILKHFNNQARSVPSNASVLKSVTTMMAMMLQKTNSFLVNTLPYLSPDLLPHSLSPPIH